MKFLNFLKSLNIVNVITKIITLFTIGLFYRWLINDVIYHIHNWFDVYTPYLISLFFNFLIFENYQCLTENCNWKYIDELVCYKRDLFDKDLPFKDRFRRKTHWIFWDQYNDKYKSYYDFKLQWNVDSNLLKEINNLLTKEKNKLVTNITDTYLEEKHKIIIFKKTLIWFNDRRKGG